MASTKINGTKILVYSAGTAIGAATSHSLTIESDTMDVTTKDSAGWAEILPTLKSWSIDVEALLTFDETPKRAYDYLYDAFIARTELTVKFSSEVSGEDKYYGQAYITSAPIEAPMEDKVTYSVTFQGTGALTRQVIT